MRIVALVNQKGGCGKTTTAIHLASYLAAAGRRTLLIDLDPQGHSTLGLGIAPPPPERSLARVLSRSGLDEAAIPLRAVFVGAGERLEVAPTGAELAELETLLARARGGEERLSEHLAPLTHELDYAIIDAPPSLGMLTLNALMAAGEAVVPVEPSLYSLHGLARLTELVKLLTARSAHEIRLRILVNAFDGRSRFARETLEEIRRTFPAETLESVIRSSVRVREAAVHGVPVQRHAPGAPIAGDYEALAAELERLGSAGLTAPGAQKNPGFVVTNEGVYITRHDVPPEAVRVAGDWGGWEPDSGVRLELHEDGGWTKFVPLTPGRYEYKLVVDGRWIPDPLNPRRIPNSVGSVNSVLEIEG